MRTPTARDFYVALTEVISTGEPRKVGSINLSPRREWPRSESARYALALDLARVEREGAAA